MKHNQRHQILKGHIYSFIAFLAYFIFLVHPNIGIYDWVKEVLYVQYIQYSLFTIKELPVYLWNSSQLAGYPAVDQSGLFIGNPETLLFSPLTFLLKILEPIQFLKTFVFFNFLVGFAGVAALAKKLNWEPQIQRIFSGLFLLSPIIIQHVAIGYLPWANLFLFPWLLFFLFSKKPMDGGIGTGIVLALVLVQGGLHIFVWFSAFLIIFIFLRIILIPNMNEIVHIPVAFFTSALLAFPRLFYSYQAFSDFSQIYFSGYSLRGFFQYAFKPPLFFIKNMDHIEMLIEDYIDGVPYWDGAVYWGFLLIIVIFLPYIYYWSRRNIKRNNRSDYVFYILPVVGASLTLLIFSFNGFYQSFITFVADLTSITALKGMEKYPFRFAIPAYYGFAFVISSFWLIINEITFSTVELLKKILILPKNKITAIETKLLKWKIYITIFYVLCISIFTLSYIIQIPFDNFMQNKITMAYFGKESLWLSSLMENADVIPLKTYLDKYDAIYSAFQRILFALSIFAVFVRALTGKLGIIRKWNISILTFLKKNHLHILEGIVIIPLIFSLGMWLRVALATPQDYSPKFEYKPPLILNLESNDIADIRELTFSPNYLSFIAENDLAGTKLILPGIPYQDKKFMELVTENAAFYNEKGRLGIQVLRSGSVHIQINPQFSYYPLMVMGVSWLLLILLVIYKKRENY